MSEQWQTNLLKSSGSDSGIGGGISFNDARFTETEQTAHRIGMTHGHLMHGELDERSDLLVPAEKTR
jgi:hypothetical protein